MIYNTMLTKSKLLEAEIKTLQAKLAHFPEGKLICTQNEHRYKWYHSDGKNRTYISKANRNFAEQLAVKKYLTLRLEECQQEKRAIDSYLQHHSLSESSSQQLLTSPKYQELLSPYFQTKDNDLTSWMNAPYIKNDIHSEHLIHKAASGGYVRSKSEAIIDMLLYTNHIPFRYECALVLGDVTLYPDFTIKHPVTGEIIYWEHFGLIDRPEYQQKANNKFQLYISHGIYPTINLIATFETKDHPLSTEDVRKVIQQYFL